MTKGLYFGRGLLLLEGGFFLLIYLFIYLFTNLLIYLFTNLFIYLLITNWDSSPIVQVVFFYGQFSVLLHLP